MKKPYYAVIFTNLQSKNSDGYQEMSERMEHLAQQQPGFIAMEHARSELGITISYWESMESISLWKENMEHQQAQRMGIEKWYDWYKIRICTVEHEYEFSRNAVS